MENGVCQMVCVELLRCTAHVLCGTWVYIVGSGVLQIPDIFHTAGFMLICDLVVSERLRICITKNFFVCDIFVLVVPVCLSSVAHFVILQ
jgi:hypothetical protein